MVQHPLRESIPWTRLWFYTVPRSAGIRKKIPLHFNSVSLSYRVKVLGTGRWSILKNFEFCRNGIEIACDKKKRGGGEITIVVILLVWLGLRIIYEVFIYERSVETRESLNETFRFVTN